MLFTNNSFCSNPIISSDISIKAYNSVCFTLLSVIVTDAMLAKKFYLCMIDVSLFHKYAFFDSNNLYAACMIFLS